jgi:hypothetical protein
MPGGSCNRRKQAPLNSELDLETRVASNQLCRSVICELANSNLRTAQHGPEAAITFDVFMALSVSMKRRRHELYADPSLRRFGQNALRIPGGNCRSIGRTFVCDGKTLVLSRSRLAKREMKQGAPRAAFREMRVSECPYFLDDVGEPFGVWDLVVSGRGQRAGDS